MQALWPTTWKELLKQGLEDDGAQWDWTALGIPGKKVRAEIIAKSAGVWAAQGLAEAVESVSAEVGMPIRVKQHYKDGDRLKPKSVVCEWTGEARSILAFERPYINLASYVSGIATQTSELTEVLKKAWKGKPGEAPRVVSTRKTLPGYRDLAIHGVFAGGGYSHRVSLSGGVLIKENHITAAGSVPAAIEAARSVAPHGLRIEIEVTNLRELSQAIKLDVDAVLLDNFTPDLVREAVQIADEARVRPMLEVSGGVNATNIASYAIAGVNVISTGSITHSVKAVDLSLLVRKT